MSSYNLLRSVIHRSRIFPQDYVVPATCKALLRTSLGAEACLIISIYEKPREKGVFRCFRIKFRGPKLGPRLSGLENRWMSIYDVALIADCTQLVDVDMGMRYPLTLNVEGLESLKLPYGLSDYSEFYNHLIAMREEYEENTH